MKFIILYCSLLLCVAFQAFAADDDELNDLYAQARTGDPAAQTYLGLTLRGMANTPAEARIALQWLEQAASQNYVDAMIIIANTYYNGYGVPKDYAKALSWYQKAAALEDTTALFSVGYFYKEGLGVKRDYAKAREYFGRACQLGLKKGCEEAKALNKRPK